MLTQFDDLETTLVDVERRELRILNAFAVDLIGISCESDLAWYVAREVVGKLGFVDCVVYFLDAGTHDLYQAAACGEKNPDGNDIVNALRIPVGHGITGRVVETGRPAIIGDLSRNSHYIRDLTPARSEICVPILSEGVALGAIDCEDPGADIFGPSHLELLETIAALMGAKLSHFRQSKALEDSEREYRRIVEDLKDVFYRTDIDGCFEMVSPSATELLGYERDELLGRECRGIYADPADEEVFLATLKVRGGMMSGYELKFRRKDGGTVWCTASGRYRYDDHGRVVGIEGIVCNIDDRKKLEQSLSTAVAQAEMANRTKTNFLAAMSHELRTPLNAILGFAEVMESEYLGPIGDPKYAEYASDIVSSGRFLLELINDLLDVSKIESGAYQVVSTPVDAVEIASECIDMVRRRAEAEGVGLSLVNSGIPKVLADRRALMQVLLNLLSNAIKFTPKGGGVSVFLEEEGGFIQVTVSDTGCGIDPDILPVLFEPFSTTAKDPRLAREGTGLGLAISKSLVTMLGGSIAVHSVPKEGTRMAVTLRPAT